MEFVVSATNLTDKTYVGVCQSVNYCNYGIGREAIATVRFHF
jgi:outer membrane receptor for monomeric catechols